MHDTLINNNPNEVRWVVIRRGQEITLRFADRMIAETQLASLPESLREDARVIAIDSAGRELLLG